AAKARVTIDLRRRIERAISDHVEAARKTANAESRETRQAADEVRTRIIELTRDSIAEVDKTTNAVLSDLSRLDFVGLPDQEIVSHRNGLESKLAQVVEQRRDILENVREQLRAINFPDEHGLITGVNETSEALEEEVLALRERVEADLELTQLGMAISVI